jgi:diguanylate cyclase (GGDEF)-like protein
VDSGDSARRVVLEETFRLVEGLAQAAFVSPKTGLFNGAALQLMAEAHDRGTTQRFAVCYSDLTGFKSINTRYTHDGGDATLKEFGRRIGEIARSGGGYAYHLSGDEFVILFDAEKVDAFVQQVAVLHDFMVPYQTTEIAARANFGIAPASEASVIDVLQRRAEQACEFAKRRRLRVPLVWNQELPDSVFFDERIRCTACGATISILVEASERTEKPLVCPNCHSSLPQLVAVAAAGGEPAVDEERP